MRGSLRRAARRRVTHAVLAGRAPLGPAVRPCLPSLVHRITAEAVTPSSPSVEPPLFKAPAFPPHAARPPLPPLHCARHGRHLAIHCLARLLATARMSIFPRTRSTSQGCALPSQAPSLAVTRAAAAVTAGRHRAPSPEPPLLEARPPLRPR
jgi:hypothetical protein